MLDCEALRHEIQAAAQPDGDKLIIDLTESRRLARQFRCTARDVEVTSLSAGIIPWRYIRNIGVFGIDGQERLLKASVAIVGVGGLGGYATEALARTGVGHLILIDGDVFQEHNLNRQIFGTESRLSASKVAAARERIAEINSAVDVSTYAEYLGRENLAALLTGADVVVDGLDRIPTRLALQEGARELGIPMVHGSVAGFLGQVMTIFPGDSGLRSLYGGSSPVPEQGLEVVFGTPAATPMAVAAWEAQEVAKIVTSKGEPLRNKVLLLDMETGTIDVLELDADGADDS